MKIIHQENNDIELILNESDLEKFVHEPLKGKVNADKEIILDYNISIKERLIKLSKKIYVTLTGEDYDRVCLEKKPLSFRYDAEAHRMSIFYQNFLNEPTNCN